MIAAPYGRPRPDDQSPDEAGAQLDKKRFELEWVLPLEPGLSTHVTLFDLECYPPHALGTGDGGDEADALQDLWTTLRDRNDSADALAHVADAYHRRTGRHLERTGSRHD
jgi:hypothetical protein